MAESEENYLRQCLERNICPVCQKLITKKFGSGQFKDGVFVRWIAMANGIRHR